MQYLHTCDDSAAPEKTSRSGINLAFEAISHSWLGYHTELHRLGLHRD
jgi:hypothetical protein